ncbi:MAG: hypothetical protein KDC49_09585 [Saprospiraceae bacterium]|nr:hypothetical protein [Saprospiraceae bacterium]
MNLRMLFMINALVEIGGGLYLLLKSDALFDMEGASPAYIHLLQLFIVAVLFLGGISLLVFKHYSPGPILKYLTLSFLAYHLIIALKMYQAYELGVAAEPYAFITHFIMSTLFVYFYFKEKSSFL